MRETYSSRWRDEFTQQVTNECRVRCLAASACGFVGHHERPHDREWRQLDDVAKAEAKRTALLAAGTGGENEEQLKKGLSGDPVEAGRAWVALRQLLGQPIELRPDEAGGYLVARVGVRRLALLGSAIIGRDERI